MKNMFKFISLAAFASMASVNAATTYGPVTVDEIDGKRVAIIDAESVESLNIPEDVVVDSIYYKRNFKAGVTVSVMFPFQTNTWAFEQNTFHLFEYVRVTKDWDGNEYSRAPWVVYIDHPFSDTLYANIPYLIIPQKDVADGYGLDLGYGNVATLNSTTNSRQVEYSDKYGSWNFVGTYDYKQWNEGDAELGRVFGFAANDINDIKAGEFVKGKAGIKIRPMRAYLKCVKTNNVLAKAAFGALSSIDAEEDIPDTLEVRILNGDSSGVQSVHFGTMNARTGEMLKDNWVDLSGRKLYRKPTTKGIYYNNGIKVIIK